MLIKIFIVLMLLTIFFSLGSALYYLLNPHHDSRKLAKALTIRICLSLTLFCIILLAFALGWIQPHGL